mgnify:FL=1|tara:strand:+ start:316 stop:573 length:258 start_codon:yes stop_codon:yes gene_type:complete
MLKEIKYFTFFFIIFLFIFFSIRFYTSDENIKKTFINLNNINNDLSTNNQNLPLVSNDTEDIIKYLNNDENSNKKKYSFWNLLKK